MIFRESIRQCVDFEIWELSMSTGSVIICQLVWAANNPLNFAINTSYLTDSYIMFTLKMESVSKNTIFGLKMMVKSGLEKIFLKFLHAGDYFSLLHKSVQNHKFSNKNNLHGGISK